MSGFPLDDSRYDGYLATAMKEVWARGVCYRWFTKRDILAASSGARQALFNSSSFLFIYFLFFFFQEFFFPRVIFCPTTARCQDTQAETCCTCSGRHAPPPGSSLGSIHRIFSSGFLPALPSFIRRESDPTRRPGSDARARVKRKNQREKKQTNKQKWPKKSATH